MLGFLWRATEVFDMTFILFVVCTAILRREPGYGASLATFACRYLGVAVPDMGYHDSFIELQEMVA